MERLKQGRQVEAELSVGLQLLTSERTLRRKVLEVVLEIERTYTKDQ